MLSVEPKDWKTTVVIVGTLLQIPKLQCETKKHSHLPCKNGETNKDDKIKLKRSTDHGMKQMTRKRRRLRQRLRTWRSLASNVSLRPPPKGRGAKKRAARRKTLPAWVNRKVTGRMQNCRHDCVQCWSMFINVGTNLQARLVIQCLNIK